MRRKYLVFIVIGLLGIIAVLMFYFFIGKQYAYRWDSDYWHTNSEYDFRSINKNLILKARERKLRNHLNYKTRDPREALKEFCNGLVPRTVADSAKVKIFTDWICHYLRYDRPYYEYLKRKGKVNRKYEWKRAVLYGTSICYGYADLLAEMCKTQNINCIPVIGTTYSFDTVSKRVVGDSIEWVRHMPSRLSRHAWNIVTYSGGNSYLIDPTWVDETQSYWYYQTDPFLFRPDHQPDDPVYQLLSPPISADELREMSLSKLRKVHSRCNLPDTCGKIVILN